MRQGLHRLSVQSAKRGLFCLLTVFASACGERGREGSAAPAAPPAQIGEASYYGPGFNGGRTASGAAFKPDALTAASPTLPLGTQAKVTNIASGKSVRVTVNDRGPFAEGRILDVSPRAAAALGMKADGVAKVAVAPVVPPPAKRRGP